MYTNKNLLLNFYVIYFILYFFINKPFVVMSSSKIFSQVEIVSSQIFVKKKKKKDLILFQ